MGEDPAPVPKGMHVEGAHVPDGGSPHVHDEGLAREAVRGTAKAVAGVRPGLGLQEVGLRTVEPADPPPVPVRAGLHGERVLRGDQRAMRAGEDCAFETEQATHGDDF